ncbi:MAG: NAD-dependent epimerase/dehydratase family protein [Inquilinaceae bacterium]
MRVLVLGGDGFCGWPTALHLSAHGHDVKIVDNGARRAIDRELGTASLTPIRDLGSRIAAWEAVSGHVMSYATLNVAADYRALAALIGRWRPDAVVHFAEQRAAPYSMKSPGHKRYTIDNNVNATHNVLCALVESGVPAHLVHLGTMGVYGYGGGGPIPEGYVSVTMPDGAAREIVHPYAPGSVYHATKCLDNVLFHFYARNDGLAITDLHQGIVWGIQTAETQAHPALINRFDYDGDFGTVLNRFLVQAAVGHPLTVHGTGGQTRAFIHIRDTVQCVRLAVESPPESGDRVRILNQMTEVHRVRDLAALVAGKTGARIARIDNPRVEAAENALAVCNDGLRRLGLDPVTLSDGLMAEVMEIARLHAGRVDRSRIPSRSLWRTPARPPATPPPARPEKRHGALAATA